MQSDANNFSELSDVHFSFSLIILIVLKPFDKKLLFDLCKVNMFMFFSLAHSIFFIYRLMEIHHC